MSREEIMHARAIRDYPPHLLEDIYADLSARNLRNQRDHEIRWLAYRLSAVATRRRELGMSRGKPRKTISKPKIR